MKNRGQFIFGAVLFITALGFYLARGISFETDLTSYSLANKDDLARFDELQSNFTTTSSDGTVVILEHTEGWKSLDAFRMLAKSTDFWEQENNVSSVSSITNVVYPRKSILSVRRDRFLDLRDQESFERRFKDWPLYADITRKFISSDPRYALLFVNTESGTQIDQQSIESFLDLELSPSIKTHFLQNELVSREIERLTRKDALLLGIISTLLILVTFFLLTKSVSGLLLIALMVAFNLAGTLMFMFILNIPFTIHMITVPCIVIVLSFTDIMHIFYHHKICSQKGLEGDALKKKITQSVQLPMLITSITNMVGFTIFLILSENVYLTNFALVALVGVSLAFLSSHFLMIPAISTMNPMISKANYPKIDALHQRIVERIGSAQKLVTASLITVFVLIIIAVIGKFKIDSSEGELLAKESDLTQANTILNEQFFGEKQAEIIIKLDDQELWTTEVMNHIDALTADVDRIFQTSYIESPSILMKRYRRFERNGHPKAFTLPGMVNSTLKRDLNEYASLFGGDNILSGDKKIAKIAFGFRDRGLEQSLADYEALNQVIANSQLEGVDVQLTGRSMIGDKGTYSFTIKIIIGLLVGILCASLLTVVFVKSVRLSLALILLNLLPVAVVLVMMLMIGIPVTPLTLFFLSLLAGICVDDSIYIVLQKRDQKGPFHIFPIAVTSSVLAIGFVALYFSSFEWIRPFSWVFLVGILLAFLMDIIILPAFMRHSHKTIKHG